MSRYLLPLLIVGVLSMAATPNGDSSFRGDRRPGLETATDEPTGENALLYRRLGKLSPNELLEILSDTPAEN